MLSHELIDCDMDKFLEVKNVESTFFLKIVPKLCYCPNCTKIISTFMRNNLWNQAYVAFNNLLGNFYQGTNTKWILHTYKIIFCIPLKGKLTFKELTLPYQSKNWSSKNCVLRFMKAQMLMKYIFVKFEKCTILVEVIDLK
jgi:hypothetical protein